MIAKNIIQIVRLRVAETVYSKNLYKCSEREGHYFSSAVCETPKLKATCIDADEIAPYHNNIL